MAPWQPPIPAGALYSPPALQLGAGLALLAYCYDSVERNGWLSINMRAAAEELNAPYSTLKDWWRLLKEGPFFSERRDRGKAGWRVRFADDWLDWRSTALDPSRRDEGGSTVLEATSTAPSRRDEGGSTVLDHGEGAVKAASRLGEGASTVLENLHVGTQESRSSTSSDDDDDMRLEAPRIPTSRQSSSSNPPAARVETGDEAPEKPPQGTHAPLTERAAPQPPVPPGPLHPAIEQAFADWQGRPPNSVDRKVLLGLLGDYGASWLTAGIEAAVAQGGKNLNYLPAMLRQCRANGTQPGDPKTTTTGAPNGTHHNGRSVNRPSQRPLSPPPSGEQLAKIRSARPVSEQLDRPELAELRALLQRRPPRAGD